jgi:hypothetical protein
MARATDVLKHAVHDANLLVAHTSLEAPARLRALLLLAQEALAEGDGEIADELLRHSALHPVTLKRLGVRTTVSSALRSQAAAVGSA